MGKLEDREWLELKLYNAEKTNKALEDEIERLRKENKALKALARRLSNEKEMGDE
jgi:cell division protein FtsB